MQDITDVALNFASDGAAHATGEVLIIDGSWRVLCVIIRMYRSFILTRETHNKKFYICVCGSPNRGQ